MYMKVHHTPEGDIVAICDAVLIGKRLAEGSVQLDLSIHSGFYMGKKVAKREAVAILSLAASANIVGEKSLDAAKSAGFQVRGCRMVCGVPHMQAYRL